MESCDTEAQKKEQWVYTDHAVFLIEPDGVVVRDLFGVSFDDLQELVEVPLTDGTASR